MNNKYNDIDSFSETIIYKEDSSLDEQVNELQAVRNEENMSKVDNDIKTLKLGIKGEKDIIYELGSANLGLYVLRDVRIKIDDKVAQIDFIVISKKYTYLIEAKNLAGNIKIDELGQFQRYYKYKEDKSIESPYRQATRHKDILLKYCKSNFDIYSGEIGKVTEEYFDKFFKPLVVLTNPEAILDVSIALESVKNSVVKLDSLVDYIKRDLAEDDDMPLLSKSAMELYAKQWKDMNVKEYYSMANRYNYKKILLEEELREFRDKKSKEMNKPYFFVFEDYELEKIISLIPRNMDELKEILPDVKVRCHGEEILDIINKKNER